jgi:Raf kinase inhibitor-like YbhB/YbcL family protein
MSYHIVRTLLVITLSVLGAATAAPRVLARTAPALQPFTLRSPGFKDGGRLPASTEGNLGGCGGRNSAPILSWSGVPAGTRSFALTLLDPDAPIAGGFRHWVVYNIPAARRQLTPAMAGRFTPGTNGAARTGYLGPCPPPTGQTHHYVFTLYALDTDRVATPALTYDALMQGISGHVLGATALIGTFSRP